MSIRSSFPTDSPSLVLDFANSRRLDPRITFTRAATGNVASYMGPDGLIKYAGPDQPRFDHRYNSATGEVESLGLLIEESRTNFSNTFDSTTNQITSIPANYLDVTSTSDINPNGSNAVAYTATYNAPGTQFHGFPASKAYTGVTSNKTISHSYFIKEFNNTDYRLYFTMNARNATTSSSNYILARFRPRTGEFISVGVGSVWSDVTTKVEEYPNGWWRATVTGTYVAEAGRENIDLAAQLLDENNQQFYNPPSANTHGLFIWGPQVEEGAFPTSYIPTNGSAVTRNGEAAGITGNNFSSFYNQSEGTFQIKTSSSYGPESGYPRLLFVCDSANNQNNCIQYYYSNGKTSFGYAIWQGGSSRWNAGRSISDGQSNNVVISYDSGGNANVTDDGVKLSYTNPVSPYVHPTTLNRVWIGCIANNTGSIVPQAHFSKVSYYPTRLSNAQLQSLTN